MTTFLLVDDDPTIRRFLGSFVRRRQGWTVVAEASDGVEAVRLARLHRPDVVILDVEMPGGDGIAALPILRDQLPNAHIVMFSSSVARREEALEAGADAWCPKGGPLSELLAVILARGWSDEHG